MFIQQKRRAKFGLTLRHIFKKTVRMHPNSYRPHGTRGTSGTSLHLRVRIGFCSVPTCTQTAPPNPALSSGILDPHPTTLHARLSHIARLCTTHEHIVSIATRQEGRACKARDQSAHMRAAWGCANARAGGQYMCTRRGIASPVPVGASSVNLSMAQAMMNRTYHTCGSMWQHAWVGKRDDTYVAGDDTLRTDMQ